MLTIPRNRCSRSSEISAHDPLKSALTIPRNAQPDARVCDVARRYGVKAQQLTTWRRLARAGRLALVTDDAADFVSIELSDPVASGKSEGPVEITIGKVSVRLDADVSAVRIAEIVTAIERGA
ncbi:transposase [Bradyrhizobium liaoningense]